MITPSWRTSEEGPFQLGRVMKNNEDTTKPIVSDNDLRAFSTTPIADKIKKDKANGYTIRLRFGLSANPPHKGHLSYFRSMMKALDADCGCLVPAATNPQKVGVGQISCADKRALISEGVKEYNEEKKTDEKEIEGDYRELDRCETNGNVSYTCDTIEDVVKENSDKKLRQKEYLLLSDESAENFYTWSRTDRIVNNTTLVFGSRPGENFDLDRMINKLRAIDAIAASHGIPQNNRDTQTHEEESAERKAAFGELEKKGKIGGSVTIKDANGNDADVAYQEFEKGNGEKWVRIDVKNSEGKIEHVEVPKNKIFRINEKVVTALKEGYVPIKGNLEVSSTAIRNAIKNRQFDALEGLVGKNAARAIIDRGMYRDSIKKRIEAGEFKEVNDFLKTSGDEGDYLGNDF